MAVLEIPDKPPQYWRTRAHADQSTDPHAKRILLTVADSYERLAGRVAERLRIMGKPADHTARDGTAS
jgi:hypothetical protein